MDVGVAAASLVSPMKELASGALWSVPPDKVSLGHNEVHVWRVQLDLPLAVFRRLQEMLSADEQARVKRFRLRKDQVRYVASRGMLRAILSRYLGTEPCQLRFSYSRYGKPGLAEEAGRQQVQFNLSHSNGLALYAFSERRAIGVDLEGIEPNIAYTQIARHSFSPREFAVLSSLPAEQQPYAFFTCWTRKEAYIKARGDGFALDPRRFQVSLSPGEPAALLDVEDEPAEVERWSLVELSPGPDYTASLAIERHNCQVRKWRWPL
jgi:4'-phosphopantetheinyl transferase